MISMIAGCSKYKVSSFVMPSWNTQLSAPLFDRTYTLGELLSKDTSMVSNGDTTSIRTIWPVNAFELFKTQALAGDTVGNNLEIGSIPTFAVAEGQNDFTVSDPPALQYASYDRAITPGSVAFVPPLPKMKRTLVPADSFPNFENATLSSGTMTIVLYNDYPAPTDFVNGLNFTDAFGNDVNIPIPGNSIPPAGTVTLIRSLVGLTVSNRPIITFTDSSKGENSPAVLKSDTLLTMSATLSNLRASQAYAIIPAQNPIRISRTTTLSDNNKVQSAGIQKGTLSVTIVNDYEMSVPLRIVVPSLVSQNNIALSDSFDMPPAGTITKTYPLTNYTLEMADPATGAPTDSLLYRITAYLLGSGNRFVKVSSTDSIKASFGLTNLQFNYFTGEVHLTHRVNISSTTQKINLGDFATKFSGAFIFGDSTQLVLNIDSKSAIPNKIGFPDSIHIKLVPANSKTGFMGDSAWADALILPGQSKSIVLGKSFVDALNSFTKATNTLPDEFVVSGDATINPEPYKVGTVSSGDIIEGTGTISVPFDFGITNATYSDTTRANGEITPAITDSSTAAELANVDSGKVVLEVNNGLPVQFSLISQLIDTVTHQVVATIPQDSIVIPAANDFNADGTVRSPVFSRSEIPITHQQAMDLGRCYMRYVFGVRTSTTRQTVLFTQNNTISLKAYANLSLTVDKNLVGK